MSRTIREQIQAGLDARTGPPPPLSDSAPIHRATLRMLGIDRDRTSVEDAARAAYTPTGPPLTELEHGIRAYRATPPDAAA